MPGLLRGQGPRIRQGPSRGGQARPDRAAEDVLRTAIDTPDARYDYIVVGSGAGGGPLAANLAVRGFRVCLIEAGDDKESYLYQVPCFHPAASEDPEMSWSFFVHHYSKDEERDWKYQRDRGGVFYPRAGTLGGCTAHNAMITIVPHDSDWNHIAEVTGDPSWRAENMRPYFAKMENCQYRHQDEWPKPKGHGFSGWLNVNAVDPKMAFGDRAIIKTVIDAWRSTLGRFEVLRRMLERLLHFFVTRDDPNDARNRAMAEGMTVVPLATTGEGRRNSTREYIKKVQDEHRENFDIKMNHFATRVLFDGDKRAVGVECLEGAHLYRADPRAGGTSSPVRREYRCTREVILAGGAFNTPQLLMLSGIGPKDHLQSLGIECLVDRRGVGSNLQDRYEVSVVSKVNRNFTLIENATFQPPRPGQPGDACFQEWEKGTGVYTSNGTIAALIKRSTKERPAPDLFLFAMPGKFEGYVPDYSRHLEDRKDILTWAVLKAHTKNRGGKVRLRSADPLEPPDINFHYFEEGTDREGEDLRSVVEAVQYIRGMNKGNSWIVGEVDPELQKAQTPEQIAAWINKNAWGHHASCSCPMGKESDPDAVVDSRFRVIGTKGLRVVDASVFPRIPGLFIVTAIYMISEKAADVISEEAGRG